MVMHVCRRHICCEVDGCSCCDFERYLHGTYPFVSPKQFRHIQETIRKKYCAKVGKKLQKSFKSRQGLEDNSNNASVFLIDDVQF